MDEPFSALDPISREQLQDELVRLQDEIQKTIVFVTHDMDEAIKIATRIAIMRDGEIIQVDTPDKILRHPKDDFVRDFIGSERLNKERGQIPTAIDLMIQRTITARPTRGLAEAFNMMKKNTVDQLYITDKNNNLEGIVSLDDVKSHYKEEDKTIQDIMQTDLIKVAGDTSMSDVAEQFTNLEIRTLPVVEDGKLQGVITRSSMIRGIAEWEQQGGSQT